MCIDIVVFSLTSLNLVYGGYYDKYTAYDVKAMAICD